VKDVRTGKAGTDSIAASQATPRAEGAMKARFLIWPAVVALLVLCARALAYAVAPSPLARVLERSAGGPSLVTVTLVSLGLASTVSILVVWLASVGVRERARLRPERVPPRLRLRRLAIRAVALYVASSLAFATFESYLHWRAGLGFHGLSCLVGPVHRNAIPFLAALALAAAALAEAAGHIYAWMRATVRALLRPRYVLPLAFRAQASAPDRIVHALLPLRARSRAPPLPA
jgi:hypothetical protein